MPPKPACRGAAATTLRRLRGDFPEDRRALRRSRAAIRPWAPASGCVCLACRGLLPARAQGRLAEWSASGHSAPKRHRGAPRERPPDRSGPLLPGR